MSEFRSDGSPKRVKPLPSSCNNSRQSSLTLYGSCEGSPSKDRTECSLLTDDEEIEVSQSTSKKDIDKNVETSLEKINRFSMNSQSDIDSLDDSERLNEVVVDEQNEHSSHEKEVNNEKTSTMNISQSLLASIDDGDEIRNDSDNLDLEREQIRKEVTFSETNSDEDLNTKKVNPPVNVESQLKLRTLGEYRSLLRVSCLDNCKKWTRIRCSDIEIIEAGKYRLLCLVRNVENSDNIIRGLCGACGKLDELNQFKKVDEKLFCCQKEPSAAAKLHIVMHVYDHTNNVDDDSCTTVVVSGRQAETFLGLRPEAWSLNSGVPEESVEKLQGLDKCIAELGVEKISQSNILLVQDTVIKDNVQTY